MSDHCYGFAGSAWGPEREYFGDACKVRVVPHIVDGVVQQVLVIHSEGVGQEAVIAHARESVGLPAREWGQGGRVPVAPGAKSLQNPS